MTYSEAVLVVNIHTFIATPRTLGQQFLFALYLKYARPAFNMGLSIRPPPDTIPTINSNFYDFIPIIDPFFSKQDNAPK